MPKIDRSNVEVFSKAGYPKPYDKPCQGRVKIALSDAGQLTQFGVHELKLAPGSWASQRHWHSHEDELVYVLDGYPTLIDDAGETQLSPRDVCTHKANDGNGHHIINNTNQDVLLLVVGARNPQNDHCHYPDIDMDLPSNGTARRRFVKKDGSPF